MSDPSIIAANPKQSAWVAANAGAGKTYTLANRVTRLLLADTDPEKILCLTYTKAAAAEMQARLFKQLGEWSMLPNKLLEQNIRTIGADLGGPEDMKKARRLFAKALETPGGLKILTIHAFCQNLLSRFPLEAGIPAAFTVLDDQTARELVAEARTRVLELAGSGDAPRAAAVAHLVTQTSEQTLNDILDAALGSDRRKLDRFLEHLADEDAALSIRRAHGADEVRDAKTIATDFFATFKVDPRVREICSWLRTGSDANRKIAVQLAAAQDMAVALDSYDEIKAALLNKDGTPRKRLVNNTLSASRPGLGEELARLQADVVEAENARRAAHASSLVEAAVVIARAMREEYARAKKARGTLDYDDLINETMKLLERADASAWVLFKLDKGIHHILIDEAQDTSPEQWRIVKSLTAEFFAGEGASRDTVRTIFAVGDEKQSIFSFQGADPAQFDLNRQFFRDAAIAAEHGFVDQPLVESRRSVPDILTFVDAVFSPDAARAGLTKAGVEIRHEAYRAKERGRVELWPTVKPADLPDDDPYVLPPLDAPRFDSPVALLARKLAAAILGWIGKVTLPGRNEPVRAGDIMILLPRREPFGSAIIRELKQRGIAVAGADRMVLTEQIAVMDLIALGRFVLLPEDDYTLSALLRSPLCGLSETDLYDLCQPRQGSVWSELERRKDERPSFAAAHGVLSEMRSRADFAPPYEFYAHALVARGLRLKLLKRLGAEANDAISEFLSLSLAYEAANTPSLEGFLAWIERGGAVVKRDMERARDEVRVMTVHGAKGLEADIVILPDTTRVPDLTTNRGGLLYTDDGPLYPMANDDAPPAVLAAKQRARDRLLEEHRRLFYVALTRARDRLIVCGFENRRGIGAESWYALAERAAKEIGAEIVRDGENLHVIGDLSDHMSPPSQASKTFELALPLWLATPAPRDASRPRLIRPFDAAGMAEPPASSPFTDNSRFRRGLLVHALLAKLPDVPSASRAEISRQFLRMQNIDGDTADALVDETLAVLNDPQFSAAFAPGSRAEVAITAELPALGPNARVNGRIDRLSATDEEVLIVDFKTNRPPPQREEDVSVLYRTQMALYRAAAERIFPGRRIVCGLVWTEGPTLMKLSNALLDAEMVRIASRLDPTGGRS